MRQLAGQVSEIAPWSYIIAGAALLSVGFSIMAPVLIRRDPNRSILVMFAPALVSLFVALAAMAVVVDTGREQVMNPILHPSGDSVLSTLVMGMTNQVTALTLGCPLTFLAVAVMGLCGVVAALNASGSRRSQVAIAVAMSVIGLMVIRGLWVYGRTLEAIFAAISGVDGDQKATIIAAALHEAGVILRLHQYQLLAIAVAALLPALLFAAKEVGTRMGLWVGAAVFGLGLVTFALTRGHAADAAQLLPVLGNGVTDVGTLLRLPRHPDAPCAPAANVPVLSTKGPDLFLYGRLLSRPSDLVKQLVSIRKENARYNLREAPATVALLAIDATFPTASLAPWLAELEREKLGQLGVITAIPQVANTHTLGRLDRAQSCMRLLELAPSGTPITRFSTWAELVSAWPTAPATFRLAP